MTQKDSEMIKESLVDMAVREDSDLTIAFHHALPLVDNYDANDEKLQRLVKASLRRAIKTTRGYLVRK